MMSLAVTVPPGELMRKMMPATLLSFSALCSDSRIMDTREGVDRPSSPPDFPSSEIVPLISNSKIFFAPSPSRTCSSRGAAGGIRGTFTKAQPVCNKRATTRTRYREKRMVNTSEGTMYV